MAERIIPSWNEIEKFKEPLSEGEYRLAHFLDDNLPETWKIFIRPDLNGSYPDMVLLNPECGFVVVQVENWPLKDYRSNDPRDRLILDERDKIVTRINRYRSKIIKLLPQLAEKLIFHGHYIKLINEVVYFDNLDNHEAIFIKEKFLENKPSRFISVCTSDELQADNLSEIIPSLRYPNRDLMERKWAQQLEFWLNPPEHPKQAREFRLNSKQEDHAEPLKGHYRLKGPSGSGKTIVIAYRAARLASSGYRVLILTFNQALWHYIKTIVDGTPYEFEWSNLNFNNFHGFSYDFLAEAGVSYPRDLDEEKKEKFLVNMMEEIIDSMDDTEFSKYKYDAIMIDEGQDFKHDWYILLSKFLTDRNEMLLVCDEKQNIYEKDTSWIHEMHNTQFNKRWRTLDSMYRFPEKIGKFINQFASTFDLDEEVKVEEGLQKRLVGRQPNPYIRWDNIDSREWIPRILDAYNFVKSQGSPMEPIPDSDITILLPNNETGQEAMEVFHENHVDVDHIFKYVKDSKNYNKRSFNYKDPRVTISTIHSYKGQETDHIIMLIPEELHGEKELDKLVYTGMTRSMEGLVVLNCNKRYWAFGQLDDDEEELIPSLDEEQFEAEIKPWIETLPYPLASMLWASFAVSDYKDRADSLLKFFEFFSLFKLNLLLSGVVNDVPVVEYYLEEKLLVELRYTDPRKFMYEPGFGTWNSMNQSVSIYIAKNLNDTKIINRFGKVDRNFLEKLSSLPLKDLLDDLKTKRNLWEGHDAADIIISPEEYEKRYLILQKRLLQLKEMIGDIFQRTFMISPVNNEYTDGIFNYTVEKMVGANPIFRQIHVESKKPMEKGELYFITSNKKQPVKLLPLLIFEENDNSFYYYGGPYFETYGDDKHIRNEDNIRYLSISKSQKSETSYPKNKIYPFIKLLEEAKQYQTEY